MNAGWFNLLAGVLIAAVSVPLWLGKVPMNRWYGVRIPKSLESDENWYVLNRFGGQVGVATGVVIALIGAATMIWPPSSESVLVLLLMAPGLLALPMLVAIFWYSSRM